MPQVITGKQANFTGRYVNAVNSLITAIDTLALLKDEWTANAYPTGANPAGNNITDAVLQDNGFQYLSATQLNQAIGAIESIRGVVATNRGYLEALRS